MEMIYNSSNYVVVEFAEIEGATAYGGGFEIVDKQSRRELYIAGESADQFRNQVQELIASEPSMEDVDEFLSQFDDYMNHPVTLH
ncbi:BTH_I0359 family protein [Pigmentiphaga litoralis]|jgi:hypothetical protein|uniref:DUF3567 domain-containing protein n=1 Tax=Pigmentiphaga litoralis TaxID=516702 RepID=A0A7Y9IRG1_9BURK|nr:DUF3567 domain-containing protein [Pigmentiphaga litoralis]NYE25183.1 hypothetical protein [Pigmentiphaga litoralis]NYE81203.1 hypothetical protein [Pigmentiphaga litoralis]GGX22926.1 hypothetical protein GCM10007242_32870 [Pigmentiphaga litoralis]